MKDKCQTNFNKQNTCDQSKHVKQNASSTKDVSSVMSRVNEQIGSAVSRLSER